MDATADGRARWLWVLSEPKCARTNKKSATLEPRCLERRGDAESSLRGAASVRSRDDTEQTI